MSTSLQFRSLGYFPQFATTHLPPLTPSSLRFAMRSSSTLVFGTQLTIVCRLYGPCKCLGSHNGQWLSRRLLHLQLAAGRGNVTAAASTDAAGHLPVAQRSRERPHPLWGTGHVAG